MKNANVFVDVDLTLVDSQGRLITGAREALLRLKDRGCHLFLWSTVGMEYAKSTAKRLKLEDLFEGYVSKPDIIIDDMPGTVLNPFVFNPNDETSWDTLVDRLLTKHVD